MEKIKKNFKEVSVIVLIFMALSAVKIAVSLVTGLLNESAALASEFSPTVYYVAAVVAAVVSFVLLIPGVYVGVKGIKIANGAEVEGKAHVVWAKILIIVSAISAIVSIAGLSNSANLVVDIVGVVSNVIDAFIFILYVKYANAFAKASSN